MVDTDGGGRHLWAEATQVGALGIPTVHQPSPLLRCLYTRKERGKGVGRENQDKKDAERVEDWGSERTGQGARRGDQRRENWKN